MPPAVRRVGWAVAQIVATLSPAGAPQVLSFADRLARPRARLTS